MRRLSWFVGGLLILSPLALVSGEIAFAPESGSTVKRTFHERTALERLSVEYDFDGYRKEGKGGELEVVNERRLVLADRYVEVREGRIEKLERTYETISSTTSARSSHGKIGAQEADAEGVSGLEGAKVVFTWDEEAEDYEVAFASRDRRRDAALLEGLSAVADLRGFVPPPETEAGDTWDVDPAALAALLVAGEGLSLEPDLDPADKDRYPLFQGYFLCLAEAGAELEGQVEATFDGLEETEAGTFASVSLAVEITARRDGRAAMAWLLDALGIDEGGNGAAGTDEYETAFEGRGTLRWDVARHVAHRLDLEGEIEIQHFALVEKEGKEFSTTTLFAGSTTLAVEVE